MNGGKEWLTFVVVVEIGIFSIIGYCIWLIVKREKAIESQRDPKNYSLKFDSCPDYYIKKFDDSVQKSYCSNEYAVVDKKNPLSQKLTMKLIQDGSSAPQNHSTTFITKDAATGSPKKPEPWDKFFTDELYDPVIKSDQERCDIINPSVAAKDDKFAGKYKSLPWTYVRTRCDGLYSK
jgi:hypothetical protein